MLHPENLSNSSDGIPIKGKSIGVLSLDEEEGFEPVLLSEYE